MRVQTAGGQPLPPLKPSAGSARQRESLLMVSEWMYSEQTERDGHT